MIDEPGPWGTGPFTLVQGASSILTRNVIMTADPYTCSWLIESEDRSPEVVLEANLDHWNRAGRGPRIQRAVFRNTLSPSQALELCCRPTARSTSSPRSTRPTPRGARRRSTPG